MTLSWKEKLENYYMQPGCCLVCKKRDECQACWKLNFCKCGICYFLVKPEVSDNIAEYYGPGVHLIVLAKELGEKGGMCAVKKLLDALKSHKLK